MSSTSKFFRSGLFRSSKLSKSLLAALLLIAGYHTVDVKMDPDFHSAVVDIVVKALSPSEPSTQSKH